MGAVESKYEYLENDPELQEAKRLFEERGVAAALETVTEELDRWRDVEIKIGITGNSGVGKSTFINTFRGIRDEDEEEENEDGLRHAVTDIVEVPCTEPEEYPYPDNPNIILMDLPGIGTPTYPDLDTYCKKVGLESYDTFLILTATRFTQLELELAEEIKSMGKSFFLIRTQMDLAEMNDRRKKNHTIEGMVRRIRTYCYQNVESLGIRENQIFLISNIDTDTWDFENLVSAILNDLHGHQKEALIRSLKIKAKWFIEKKRDVLKSKTWMVILLFIPAGVLDVVSLGFASHCINWMEIQRRIIIYRFQFGLPEKDSVEFTSLDENLKERMMEFYPENKNGGFLPGYFGCGFKLPIYITWKTASDTKKALDKLLDDMAEVACEIFARKQIDMHV